MRSLIYAKHLLTPEVLCQTPWSSVGNGITGLTWGGGRGGGGRGGGTDQAGEEVICRAAMGSQVWAFEAVVAALRI